MQRKKEGVEIKRDPSGAVEYHDGKVSVSVLQGAKIAPTANVSLGSVRVGTFYVGPTKIGPQASPSSSPSPKGK